MLRFSSMLFSRDTLLGRRVDLRNTPRSGRFGAGRLFVTRCCSIIYVQIRPTKEPTASF